jgi:hypothetical protein
MQRINKIWLKTGIASRKSFVLQPDYFLSSIAYS